MIRMSRLAGKFRSGAIGSGLALALAACAGSAVVAAGFATTAAAQEEKNLSRGFKRAAGPVIEAYANTSQDAEAMELIAQIAAAAPEQRPALAEQLDKKLGGVRSEIEKMVAAIESVDDRALAGQYIVSLGAHLADQRMQQRGLILQLESGLVAPELVGRFSQFAGRVAFATQDYATARKYLTMELNAGAVAGGDGGLRLLEAYFGEQMVKEGLSYFVGLPQSNADAYSRVSENTLRIALQKAYEADLFFEMGQLLLMLDSRFPSEDSVRYLEVLPAQFAASKPLSLADATRLAAITNDPRAWHMAISSVLANGNFTIGEAVDSYRLLLRVGGLRTEMEYKHLLSGVGPNIYPTEAEMVINAGVQAGLLSLDDEDVISAKERIEDSRGADTEYLHDQQVLAEARSSAESRIARALGNTAYSLGEYGLAKEMLQIAVDKGDGEVDLLRLRLGIAQLLSGEKEAGRATLSQVNGKYVPVAQLWQAYGQAS